MNKPNTGSIMRLFLSWGICFFVLVVVFPVWGEDKASLQEQEGKSLGNDQCVLCHADVIRDIEEAGQAHKDSLTCTDCHNGHPPEQLEIIPSCSMCHSGEPHFELEQCLSCHRNPHRPLELKLSWEITDACLTCHEQQGTELKTYPSYHTSIHCTACHNTHGEVPDCLYCHQPHSDTMTAEECHDCHKAHMPLEVTYGPDIPSASCAACHDLPYFSLLSTKSKHGKVACVQCHPNRHKEIHACTDCHGVPHEQSMMEKYNACGICHDTAHNLAF